MPLPDAVSIRMGWADEDVSSPDVQLEDLHIEDLHIEDLYAEACLIGVLHTEILEAHEARCDRIARRVMARVAELPAP
jgi:hypothetical protein